MGLFDEVVESMDDEDEFGEDGSMLIGGCKLEWDEESGSLVGEVEVDGFTVAGEVVLSAAVSVAVLVGVAVVVVTAGAYDKPDG